jgi:hypothetical protein
MHFASGVFVRPGEVIDPRTADARLVEKIERARRPPTVPRALAFLFLFFLLSRMVTEYVPKLSPSRGALLRTQVGLLGLIGALLVASQLVLWLTPVSDAGKTPPRAGHGVYVALFPGLAGR